MYPDIEMGKHMLVTTWIKKNKNKKHVHKNHMHHISTYIYIYTRIKSYKYTYLKINNSITINTNMCTHKQTWYPLVISHSLNCPAYNAGLGWSLPYNVRRTSPWWNHEQRKMFKGELATVQRAKQLASHNIYNVYENHRKTIGEWRFTLWQTFT